MLSRDRNDIIVFNFVLPVVSNRSKVNVVGKMVWILIMLGKQPKSVQTLTKDPPRRVYIRHKEIEMPM